mmetsp:Transcript_33883/g.101097  ORF Transcript_33883/g.101097 Transcript_33883/m.101097 type:complete len:205 (-) Transcript_33883:5312-5926(-)
MSMERRGGVYLSHRRKEVCFLLLSHLVLALGFSLPSLAPSTSAFGLKCGSNTLPCPHAACTRERRCHRPFRLSVLHENGSDGSEGSTKSDDLLLGAAGSTAGLVTLYSESVLARTGCGLPAGPFGLVGAIEGISYLGVVALAAYSLYTKIKTGGGLRAGPYGVLGAAEGLSFLAVVAGLLVLVFQILNFGYIPNAVPMEGGMCQ